MTWLRRWDRASRVAAAGLSLAALVVAVTVVGAVRVEPPGGGSAAATGWDPLPEASGDARAIPDSELVRAVSSDPFREGRSPPDARYVLPGNRPDRSASTRPAGRDRLTLEGTALLPGRPGLAAFRLPDGRSHVVRSGGQVNGLRVVRVQEGQVVLRGPDTTLVLRVETPGQGGRTP